MLPCPKCGSAETNGTFCNKCRSVLAPLVRSVKPCKLTLCESCDRVKLQGGWKRDDNAVRKTLCAALVFADETEIAQVEASDPEIERKPGIRKTATALCIVRGRQGDAADDYEEEYDIPLEYFVTKCAHCRKSGSYYEGILQLRNASRQAAVFIAEYLAAHAVKGVHATSIKSVKNGTDYYLNSNRAVGHLARKLHKTFGGELKVNAQHFSEDKQAGRILYRTNALVELPEYAKGDVIKRDDAYYFVVGIAGKVKAENLRTGGENHFPYRSGDAVRLEAAETHVSSADPLEVLHPRTFEPVRPLRSKYAPAELSVGTGVRVAFDGSVVVLVPELGNR